MKVGELAARTGLSVRTLHHYDEVGLLSPARRTPSGHRLYGLEEVRRLQQIASLKQLGLTLEEIRDCLDRPGYSLEEVLGLQLRRLQEEMARQTRLASLLEGLRRRLAAGDALSLEDVTATIEASVRMEKYFSPEEQERIRRRGEEVGVEGIRHGAQAWADLFGALRSAMAEGVDPGDPRVLALARRGRELVHAFTGGDPGITDSLRRMYAEEGGVNVVRSVGGEMDGGLWDYYGKAMTALGRSEGE